MRQKNPPAGLRALFRSPALATAGVFALGGVGFALANLLLAGALPAAEYGYIALFLALNQLGIAVGPLGMDVSINRHLFDVSAALLRRVLWSSALVGAATGLLAHLLYGMAPVLAAILAATIVAGALNRIAGAVFQSRQQFRFSLFLSQSSNWILLCSVPVILAIDRPSAVPVAIVCACGHIALAVLGWTRAADKRLQPAAVRFDGIFFKEGLAVVSLQFAAALFFQLDRVLIPRLLSIDELASFSVVAALAISPFRMLQVGAGYSLLPRLRASADRASVYRLIGGEGAVIAVMAALAAIAVVGVAPWVERHLLADRYSLSLDLLAAMIAIGWIRIWNAFAATTVNALGTSRQLATINICGWVAIGVGVAGAVVASRAGLIGVVVGVGAGWLVSACAASWVAVRAIGRWQGRPQRSTGGAGRQDL